MPSRYKGMTVPTTEAEKQRIASAAASRDLDDTTLVRLLVQGALSMGGATFDRLLETGERTGLVPVQRRKRKTRYDEWVKLDEGLWELDGEYRIEKTGALRATRIAGVRDDPDRWWQLFHVSNPSNRVPVAFRRIDAFAEAVRLIESGGAPPPATKQPNHTDQAVALTEPYPWQRRR